MENWRMKTKEPQEYTNLPTVRLDGVQPVKLLFMDDGKEIKTRFTAGKPDAVAVKFGVKEGKDDKVLITSSVRLLTLLKAVAPSLTGKTVIITASGTGFERQYTVVLGK